MRFHGFPGMALRLVSGRVAPLSALLVGVAVLLGPGRAAAQGDIRNFALQNNSGLTIVSLQVAQNSLNVPWGPNILTGPIGPGQAADVSFFGGGPSVPCVYDIRVLTADGQTGVDIADLCSVTVVAFPGQFANVGNTQPSTSVQGAVAVPQAQASRTFTVRNSNDRWAVVEVNVADSGTRMNWGSNMLNNIINPRQSGTVSFTPGNPSNCFFDIRVMSSDGFEDFDNGVNLCQPYTFTFQ